MKRIGKKKRKGISEAAVRTASFHLRAGADEKKNGQTSDVSEKVLKRFKVLKRKGDRLVYQQTSPDSKSVYCAKRRKTG